MCFSASASFIAGGALSAVGAVTLKKAKKSSEKPFAALPLLFGVQQIIEGIIWLSIHQHLLLLQSVTTMLYSFFAYALWPIFVPFAVLRLETDTLRRSIIAGFFFLGSVIGLYLLYFIIRYPVTVEAINNHLVYRELVPFGAIVAQLYILAGCGSCFASSHRFINYFGLFLVISVGITYYFYAFAFASVWCFFAALLSVFVYLFISRKSANQKVAGKKRS